MKINVTHKVKQNRADEYTDLWRIQKLGMAIPPSQKSFENLMQK